MSPTPPRKLLVADSFRVRSNPKTGAAEARGFEAHLDRFRYAVLDCMPGKRDRERVGEQLQRAAERALYSSPGYSSATFTFALNPLNDPIFEWVDAFIAEARPEIAAAGEGFPRLELWEPVTPGADPELAFALRPLPALRDTIELRTAGRIPSDHPGRKGPNILRYSELNRELGCEALLLDKRGRVLEGATTSLIWWTDDTDESGHYVDDWREHPRTRIQSITEGLLQQAAQDRLVGEKPHRQRRGSLQPGRATPEELTRCEVWAVNALHGIRPVTSIDGVAMPDPQPRRLRWFREALDRCWEAV